MKPSLVLLSMLAATAIGTDAVQGAIRDGRNAEERAAPGTEGSWRSGNSGRNSKALVQALRLDQYGEDCVAHDTAASLCLLTVEGFNRALEDGRIPLREEGTIIPPRSRLDSIRGEALRRMLEALYVSSRPIPSRARDSLSDLADAAVRDRIRASRAALGDAAVRAAYRELYPAAFQGREEILYEVLASTDSLLLDSLLSGAETGARRAWQKVPETDLPPEAARAAREAGAGAMAGPVRVPYGYLYLREASRRKLSDVPPDSVLPFLISWATLPAGGAPGWEREMEEHYWRNPGAFATPDTVTFRAWLLPGAGTGDASRRPNARMMRRDTSKARSMTIPGTELPRSVREALSDYAPIRRGDAVGPIPSGFGNWYLAALEVRKGGRRLGYGESRRLLGKRVYGWEGPEAFLPAVADARAKENEIRSAIAARYRAAQKRSDAARRGTDGAANAGRADNAESPLPWEAETEAWMRNHLVLRYVGLPGPGASEASGAAGPLPDSSWSDGAGNAGVP